MPFGEEAINNTGERPVSLKYSTMDLVRQKSTGYQKHEETSLDLPKRERMRIGTGGLRRLTRFRHLSNQLIRRRVFADFPNVVLAEQ